MRVFITKLGVVSALGVGVGPNWETLLSERSPIAWTDAFQRQVGLCPLSDAELAARLGIELNPTISRTSLLAGLAAKEAWLAPLPGSALRTGLISGTSVGGMDRMEQVYWEAKGADALDDLSMQYDNGRTTDLVAQLLGIRGWVSTISTACSSGANAIMQGGRLIRSGQLDRMLVGSVDPLIQYNLAGFSSLKIYSPTVCQPFDAQRQGLNLGEGAGFLLLENEQSLKESGHLPLAELTGWANAADAYHQTASSPQGDGATRSMQGALEIAGLSPDRISYVNAHGTGTPNNDLSESVALQRVFPQGVPPFSSTKAYSGHTLAAAGAIEAVFCVLALQQQILLPNLHFEEPIAETGLRPIQHCESASLQHVLSNSFGFGGNCTSLILSTPA